MKISSAKPEDIPELVNLIQTSYRGDKGWCRDSHLLGGNRVTSEMVESMLCNPDGLLWKCVSEDSSTPIIGCVYTEMRPARNMLFTGTLCVHPDFQTAGIGKRLMKAVEERARSLAVSAITLQVVIARKELIQWYERQGFKLVLNEIEPFPESVYGEFKAKPEDLALISLQKDL